MKATDRILYLDGGDKPVFLEQFQDKLTEAVDAICGGLFNIERVRNQECEEHEEPSFLVVAKTALEHARSILDDLTPKSYNPHLEEPDLAAKELFEAELKARREGGAA